MSSTDRQADLPLHAFYTRHVVPAAAQLRNGHRRFFEWGPDRAASTYFCDRAAGSDYVSEYDSRTLGEDLRRHWEVDGAPELLELVDGLTALLGDLAEEDDRWSEVSAFIYAMF